MGAWFRSVEADQAILAPNEANLIVRCGPLSGLHSCFGPAAVSLTGKAYSTDWSFVSWGSEQVVTLITSCKLFRTKQGRATHIVQRFAACSPNLLLLLALAATAQAPDVQLRIFYVAVGHSTEHEIKPDRSAALSYQRPLYFKLCVPMLAFVQAQSPPSIGRSAFTVRADA